MGLVASSCMSSNAISSAVFSPITKKKKLREVFPHSSSTYPNNDDKNSSQCGKQPRRRDKKKSGTLQTMRIDVSADDEDDLMMVITALLIELLITYWTCVYILAFVSIYHSIRNLQRIFYQMNKTKIVWSRRKISLSPIKGT